MKKLLIKHISFLLLFTFILSDDLSAQQCGTDVTGASIDPVTADYSATTVHVKAYFILVRKSDGSGDIQMSTLYTFLAELEDNFGSHNIIFDTMCTQFIDNTAMYDDGAILGGKLKEYTRMMGSSDGLTIFIQKSSSGGGAVTGQSGQIPYPSPYCWFQFGASPNVGSHEIGHTFNLLHLGYSAFGRPCEGIAAHDTIKGDLVADTPIERPITECDSAVIGCAWDTAVCRTQPNCRDGCDNLLLHSDATIIMSELEKYSCTDHFTTGQANRMKSSIINNTGGASNFGITLKNDTITGNDTIRFPTQITQDILIQSGGRLVVLDTVYMPTKGRIIIEPGGILSISGGKITRGTLGDPCSERIGDPRFWRGIEMQISPSGPYPKLYINNGTVEFSELGIHNPSNRSAGNAHISINYGIFRNNMHSIHLLRAASSNTEDIRINKSRFYHDGFSYLDHYTTQIKIDNSKVYLDSCLFDNPNHKTHPTIDTSYAINVMNSTIGVQRTTFEDSLYGIQTNKFLSTTTLAVTTSKFDKMIIGINTKDGTNEYSITKNTFVNSYQFGLVSNHCKGYIINKNHFKKISGGSSESKGILMSESGTGYNVIQLDTFSSLLYGNVSEGENGSEINGLQYLCNTYNFNTTDFYLKGKVSGIQGSQQIAAGNNEGGNPNDVTFNLTNFDLAKLNYYYRNRSGEIPAEQSSTKKLTKFVADTNLNCTLKGKPKHDTIIHYVAWVDKRDTMLQRKDVRSGLIDGGNTSALLSYIAGANSGTATFLHNHLINKSPWLSSAVVLAAYNRTDIWDSTHRANLLYANPDLFAFNAFRLALSDADSPLLESSLEALDSLTNYATARTALESEIAMLNLELNALCHDKLHELKIDTLNNQDSILVWLDRENGYESKREIMASYYYSRDFSEASDALEYLGSLDNLTESQESDVEALGDLLPYIEDVIEDDRYEGNLSEEEIEWMVDFAEGNNNHAGAEVRGVLKFYYGISLEDAEYLKAPKRIVMNIPGENVIVKEKTLSGVIGIFPNPTNNEITILLPVIDESYWDIELLDLNGKVLVSQSTDRYKMKIDISKIPNGLFLVHFLNGKNERIVKRIQIMK